MKKKTINKQVQNTDKETKKTEIIEERVEIIKSELDPSTHKKRVFVINFAFYCCILVLVYLFGKYLLPILVPFIIGFLYAFAARNIAIGITGKPGKSRQIVILIVLYIVSILLIAFGFVIVVNGFAKIQYSAIYSSYIEPALNIIYKQLINFNHSLPESMASLFDQVTSSIFDAAKSILTTVSSYAINFVKGLVAFVPESIVSVTVIVVSSIYFASDYEKIVGSMMGILPEKVRNIINDLKYFIGHNIFSILKSYIMIIFITFTELLIAFIILGVNNKVLVALLIALMDILPIVGVGTALIPWLIIELIFGNYVLAIGLAITYTVITVIRNIIEPRMVGTTLGLDPLLSLVCMIVGLGLYGLVGMMGFPLIAAFIIFEKNKN